MTCVHPLQVYAHFTLKNSFDFSNDYNIVNEIDVLDFYRAEEIICCGTVDLKLYDEKLVLFYITLEINEPTAVLPIPSVLLITNIL